MLKDTPIANDFKLSKTKCSYVIKSIFSEGSGK